MSRIFVVALAALPLVAPAQTISYADSSTQEKLQSKVGLGIGDDRLGLSADMTLIGYQGETKVLPRISSSWSSFDFLAVETVINYPDLNAADSAASPTLNTQLRLDPRMRFLDRVEATLQRAESTAQRSLRLQFTEISTGLNFFGGRPLNLRSDFALQDGRNRRSTISNLTSSWGLGRAIDVQSVLRLDDSATGALERSRVDTKLVYQSPLMFIERLEGQVRHERGARTQSLSIAFPKVSAGIEHESLLSLQSRALVKEMLRADGEETRTVGFETRLSAVRPPMLGGRNALSFKVERSLEAEGWTTSSLAYDHAWAPTEAASIGLNVKMLRDADDLAPIMDLTWSARF